MDRGRITASIERALSAYGDTTKGVILWHMQHTYGLKLEEIPDKPEKFVDALHEMFGSLGNAMEESMAIKVAAEFKIDYKGDGLAMVISEINAQTT